MFGFGLETWFEVNIDLEELAAGEYECEIRCEYSGALYKVSTFNIAVRTFPTAWLATNIGIIALISVGSIITIKILREGKGWWGFQGKYGK